MVFLLWRRKDSVAHMERCKGLKQKALDQNIQGRSDLGYDCIPTRYSGFTRQQVMNLRRVIYLDTVTTPERIYGTMTSATMKHIPFWDSVLAS